MQIALTAITKLLVKKWKMKQIFKTPNKFCSRGKTMQIAIIWILTTITLTLVPILARTKVWKKTIWVTLIA